MAKSDLTLADGIERLVDILLKQEINNLNGAIGVTSPILEELRELKADIEATKAANNQFGA